MRKERSVTPYVLEADCAGKTDRNEHLSEDFFNNNVRGRVLEKGEVKRINFSLRGRRGGCLTSSPFGHAAVAATSAMGLGVSSVVHEVVDLR